jgi:2-polyprenyl-3-methyl-5-hydroxy-6-metoxy-1,4-benzoquinol methylase
MIGTQCRICNQNTNTELLNFGNQPIVHHFLKNTNESFKTFPFKLGLCENCNFLSLLEPIKPSVLYENYFTFSDWKFQPHTKRLIEIMSQILGMNKDTELLDIGCNDGKFLKELNGLGINNVRGIEPSTDAYNISISKKLNVEKGFFPTTSLKKNEYDIIVFRQVLEHIIDLDLFLSNVNKALKDKGSIVIEIPDTSWNLECLDYSLWEEHVNYFTINTLKNLLSKHQFEIIHYERTLFSGVALTVFAQKAQKKLSFNISIDERNKINNYKNKFNKLKTYFHESFDKEENIVIYGCGSRSSNFVNLFSLDMICCFVDDQNEKQNYFLPGYSIPIKPWSNDFKNSTILLGVNAENEEKVIMKRGLKADNFFSILPPSKHLPNFWRELIN